MPPLAFPKEVTVQYSAPLYSAVEEDKQVTLSVLLLGETTIPVIVAVSSIPLFANSSRTAATCESMNSGLRI